MTSMNREETDVKKRPFSKKWIIIAAVLLVSALAGGFFIARSYETQKVEAGREAIATEKWDEAVTALDSAISLQPAFLKQYSDEALALRGFAHYKLGDDEAALSDFGAAMDINNHFYDLPAYRADILFRQEAYGEAVGNANMALDHADALPLYLQAQLHGQKALALVEMGEETAVSSLNAALALSDYLPDEMLSRLLTARARAAFADGDNAAGLADMAQAEAVPLSVDGALLVEKTAVLHQQGDNEAALAASESALAADQLTDEQTAVLHLIRADIAYQQGDLDEAIARADAAAELVDGLAQPDALRAWQQYRQFEWDNAAETADAALELDDDNALAHRVRGAVAYWHGRYDDALTDLDRAIELDPNDVEALALRTVLHYTISNDAAAEADAERAAEIAPNTPAALWAKAAVYINNYEREDGYEPLTQAIALDDQRPELYEWRGDTYLYSYQDAARAADYEAALALYPEFGRSIASQMQMQMEQWDNSQFEETTVRLLDLYPDWDYAYRGAAAYYTADGDDLDRAMEYAEQAIALNPASSKNYITRGRVWTSMGEYENASADYEQALAITPDSVSTRIALSNLANDQNDKETAVEYMKQAFALSPSPDIRMILASNYGDNGEPEKTWKLTHELLAVDPDNPMALLMRSLLWIDAGNDSEALNNLTVLLNNYPTYAHAYVIRAQLRLNEGKFDEVREDANLALKYAPFDMDTAHYLLGMAELLESEDLETAVIHIENFVRTGDKYGFKYSLLAGMYADLGRFDDAMDAVEAGLAIDDEDKEQLLLDRSHIYARQQEEELAQLALTEIISTSTDLDILSQAEGALFYMNQLPALVDGRREFANDDYRLTYTADWRPEPIEDDLFSLYLIQEEEDWNTIFLAGAIHGVAGYTSRDIADAVESSLSASDSFQSLSIEPARIDGHNGLVRYYRLELPDKNGDPIVVLGRQYYLVYGDTAFFLSMETHADNYDNVSAEWDAIIKSFELQP